MWDWILANKEWLFSGAGVAIAAALLALMRTRLRSRERPQEPHQVTAFSAPKPAAPADIEIRAQWFELSLSQQIPQIEVWVYLVNHLPKSVKLHSFQVNQFHVSPGPAVEAIPLPEQPLLAPRHTTSIQCRRPLADTEVRALAALDSTKPLNARASVTLRAAAGRRVIEMTSVQLSVTGWIVGAPNLPAA